MPTRLVDSFPSVEPERLVAELVPPPRFGAVRFDSYLPDPAEPSQAQAVLRLRAVAEQLGGEGGDARTGRWWRKRAASAPPPARGVYLDGGFGVGKTHLLASLWHAAPGPRAYGTFVGFTNLVGALGFQRTVDALSGHVLVCIDEFELDDPGDTVLMSTLLDRLASVGVTLAATSNTLPGALGEGRFAADDFLREIQTLAGRFEVLRVDGEDYRHRGLPPAPQPWEDDELIRHADTAGPAATLDDFAGLVEHLARLHPSRYGALLDGVSAVHLHRVETVHDQSVALRLVVLADRLYDRDVPVVASGVTFDRLFTPEMLRGGYRKKYVRAVSRLCALAREGRGLTEAGDPAGEGPAQGSGAASTRT